MDQIECRDTFGYFNVSIFPLWTCSMCFHYLFQTKKILIPNFSRKSPRLVRWSDDQQTLFLPNVSDHENVQDICSFLEESECQRWQDCCEQAIDCCANQQSIESLNVQSNRSGCSHTWDGFGCYPFTLPGEVTLLSCPDYIEHGISTGFARKTCTENGTWWKNPLIGNEWTDYSDCLPIEAHKSIVYVGLVCGSLSIALLLPACFILLYFKQLRTQNRIKMHLCLFISFLMSSVTSLLWDILILQDRLDNPAEASIIYQHTIGCRVLYFLKRYSRTCNYFWMFSEAFYLHRLLVKAFKVPKSIIGYHLFGWGISVLPISVYTCVKIVISDKGCWVEQLGPWEWILYLPNLMTIIGNIVLLGGILRILLTQVHTHPNEPNNYRRAIKATFVLVPLFGIHLFCVIFRPNTDSSGRLTYELISKLVTDSQGIVIAIMFCFLNGEVCGYLNSKIVSCLRTMDENVTGLTGTAMTYNTPLFTATYKPNNKDSIKTKEEYIGMSQIK